MEDRTHILLPILGFATAGITAFYMFRLIYMTFFGHARDEHKHHHAHEMPLAMTIPTTLLAILSLSIFWAGPTGIEAFDQILPVHWFDTAVAASLNQMGVHPHEGNEEIHHMAHSLALIISLCCAALGILVSSLTYLKSFISAPRLKSMFGPLYDLVWNKYFFDELYVKIIIQKGLLSFNNFLARFDDVVIDGILVDGWAKTAMVVKTVVGKFDDIFVDRILVDGASDITNAGGWVIQRFQTGKVQQYLILTFIALGFGLFFLTKA